MTHQVALTFCADVDPARRTDLDLLLNEMASDPAHNSVLSFGDLPQTHFARIVVLDGTAGDTLLLTLDCDASIRDRIRDLAQLTGDGIDQLFGSCTDYPTSPTS